LKLVEHDLVETSINLMQGAVPACLNEVSGGRLGDVTNLVQQACILAAEERSSALAYEHLEKATDQWAIALGKVNRNAFRIARLASEKQAADELVDAV
jgi:hypothetical protein